MEICKTFEILKNERITVNENNKVVSEKSELNEIFSKYFGNMQNLEINDLSITSLNNDMLMLL